MEYHIKFNVEVGTVSFTDDSYGEISLMIHGPRGGEIGYANLTKEQVCE